MAKDPGNGFFNALKVGQLSGRRVFSDSLSQSDKFDFYKLRLSSRSALTGTLDRLSENADLALYGSNQKRIAFSSKADKQTESLTAVVDAGDYFVRVQRKSGSPKYRLSLSSAVPPDEAGNATTAARIITAGSTATTFKDAVGTTDTDDFYKIDTTAFSNLGLSLTGLSADANVQILNSTGAVIRSSVASGATSESINAGLAAGTYFIRVFPGANTSTTNYDLSVTLNPLKFVGLTDDNKLVSFSAGGSTSATNVAVTGLQASEKLLGIDFRPATGQLFGLGSSNRLYTLNSTTGAATAVGTGTLTTTLSGTSFGVDFNPVVDRLRVVSDTDQNLRLDPNTGAIAGTDTPLNPAGNDIGASAYTNNRAGATATTLFSIDSLSNQLVRQGGVNGGPAQAGNPNAGVITSIGALGVDFGANVGFDIFTDGAGVDAAFATSGSTLYSINLTSGAATAVGTVGAGTTSFNLVGLATTA
jgi:Domain of unknown function (DUF4394)/Bacterial pre-peptidase C-terminal domain